MRLPPAHTSVASASIGAASRPSIGVQVARCASSSARTRASARSATAASAAGNGAPRRSMAQRLEAQVGGGRTRHKYRGPMAPVAPDEVDRLLTRLDAAARAVGAAEHPDEAISVELIVRTGDDDRSWFVELDEAGGRAALGPAPDPTVVVRIDDDT